MRGVSNSQVDKVGREFNNILSGQYSEMQISELYQKNIQFNRESLFGLIQ